MTALTTLAASCTAGSSGSDSHDEPTNNAGSAQASSGGSNDDSQSVQSGTQAPGDGAAATGSSSRPASEDSSADADPASAGGLADAGQPGDGGPDSPTADGGESADADEGPGSRGPRSYSSDPATFGGAPRCGSEFAFCQDFEDTAAGELPSDWITWRQAEQTMEVVHDVAMRGQASLRITVPQGGFARAWIGRDDLGALKTRIYGRVFTRIAPPAAPQFVHWDALAAVGMYDGHDNEVRLASTGTGVGSETGNWAFIYNVQPSGPGAGGEFATEAERSAHPVVGAWMCIEWLFDQGAQEARFWLDGEELDYLHIDQERSEIPVIDRMFVGFAKYQDSDPFEVFVDEIAYDDERIGCNN